MPYLNKDKDKKKYPWIAQVRVKGMRKRKKCVSKAEAKQWETEERKTILEVVESQTHIISLADWANEYLTYVQKNYVRKTYLEKRLAFKEFFQHVNPVIGITDLQPLQILQHFENLDSHRSGNAVNKQRKNLAAAWNWGIKFMNFPMENLFLRVMKYPEQRKERRVPTLEEFWKVVEVVESEQDRLMLLTYLQTGARREELYRMQWKDVDFESNQVRLYWRKNQAGQWRSVWLPVKDELIDLLKDHRKVTGLLRFVFINPRYKVPYVDRNKWMPRLCKKAGVESFGIHGIRHLFASILAAANTPLVEIQRMLRHNSISTTQRYIHSLKKENREVLTALPGLKMEQKAPQKAPQKRAIC